MNVVHSSHQFADAATARVIGLRSNDCELLIRQGPENAKIAVGKEKDRKPVDPPPIIQLKISPQNDPGQNYLQSPYFFMSCNLIGDSNDATGLPAGPLGTALAGTLVSSLHRLKDTDNSDGAFFVFGDLSIKIEGSFRLQFNLYEMRERECFHMQSIRSDSFPVHSHKNFPGMSESTFLTRSFSDQGVRLRLRKEPRTLLRKRGPASDDYQPRTYRNRQQSQGGEQQGTEPQDTPRKKQAEKGESMQLPIHSNPYDQARQQQVNRSFSMTSSGSYNEEAQATNKRPRTGSDQGTTFGQQQALDSPQQYSQQNFSTHQFVAPQQPQQHYGSYTYGQSPQPASMSSRNQYFPQRVNIPAYSYDPNSHRSPQSASFGGQAQNMPYNTHQPVLAATPVQRAQSGQTYEGQGLGINTRTQMPASMTMPMIQGMQAPTYGRMPTGVNYGPPTPVTPSSTYGDYSPHTGAMGGHFMGSRPGSMGTTSAPGL
ncbi:Spore development regulator RYP2 [Lachnellula suecica]|uniref:Spore development regulator RYP2 n=1 Tax=Lachnellula suecica TaxID=602035 RepID=A0A8T9CI44_9HELO|nr:Spore development regulator RYP2 [Lachnellula suecica]